MHIHFVCTGNLYRGRLADDIRKSVCADHVKSRRAARNTKFRTRVGAWGKVLRKAFSTSRQRYAHAGTAKILGHDFAPSAGRDPL
jgi:hypothetical protein